MIKEKKMEKQRAKIGDVFYSDYFGAWCQILEIYPTKNFKFKVYKGNLECKLKWGGNILRSEITTKYLEERHLLFRRLKLNREEKGKD